MITVVISFTLSLQGCLRLALSQVKAHSSFQDVCPHFPFSPDSHVCLLPCFLSPWWGGAMLLVTSDFLTLCAHLIELPHLSMLCPAFGTLIDTAPLRHGYGKPQSHRTDSVSFCLPQCHPTITKSNFSIDQRYLLG